MGKHIKLNKRVRKGLRIRYNMIKYINLTFPFFLKAINWVKVNQEACVLAIYWIHKL